MNCKSTAKYLYAHADGELGMSDSLAVLEHLSMCPECCQKVHAQHQLKDSLLRVEGQVQAPADLRARIRQQIRIHEAPPGLFAGFFRFGRPLAAAAGVAIVIFGAFSWRADQQISAEPRLTSVLAQVQVSDGGPIALALADRILQAHRHGADQGSARHDPALPRDGVAAAKVMARSGLNVLGCDQLGEFGASFESAALCHFTDTAGQVHPSAHIVYRSRSGEPVSLMSIEHLPELVNLHKQVVESHECLFVAPTQDAQTSIVAWNCPKCTHVICAPKGLLKSAQLLEPVTPQQSPKPHFASEQ